MEKRNSSLAARWREIRPLRAGLGRASGFASTLLFALYNGALGLLHASLWHGSICVYYLLLSLLRGCLLIAERIGVEAAPRSVPRYQKPVFYATAGMLLVVNLALTAPVTLMALDRRPVQTGLIPAIASAAYTTYKISAATTGLRLKSGTLFSRELHLIRFFDALVSVLVLQNTLLIAVDGYVSARMLPLVAISSGGIVLLIFIMTLIWVAKNHIKLSK